MALHEAGRGGESEATQEVGDSLAADLGSLATFLGRAAETGAAAEQIPKLPPDAQLVIEERLGAGGMGVVYKAFDRKLERHVAIKVHKAVSSWAAEMLIGEARAMAKLAHPNVVAVYDVRELEGMVFVVMEYVSGPNLRDWLHPVAEQRPGPRSTGEILDAFAAAGEGLAAAHEAGLIHRDFKPDNVIVGDDGRVRVADFGLARAYATEPGDGDPTASPTPAEDAVGTPAYMSPEQLAGEAASARTDQYSFCLALLEALSGESPRKRSTLEELRARSASGDPPERARLSDVSPAWLRRVLARGLALEPDARYADMPALLAAVARGRRRRRRAVARGGALAAVAAASVAWAVAGGQQAPCGGFESRLAGIWDGDVTARVQQAFEATGLPHGLATAGVVIRELDGYRERWVDGRTRVCQAAAHGELSPTALDRAMACYDRGRAQLQALAGLLVEPDAELVATAASVAAGLDDPDLCGDVSRLASSVSEPEEPEVRAAVEELRTQLAVSSTLLSAGRTDEGMAIVDAQLARARELGVRPALAEALRAKGRALNLVNERSGVREILDEAVAIATAEGDDRLAVQILSEQVFWVGAGGMGDARRWFALGLATLERLGGDETLEASLRCNYVSGLAGAGQIEEALEQGTRCAELSAKVGDALFHARGLLWLGNAHSTAGDYQAAKERFSQALALTIEAVGEMTTTAHRLHSNLGVTEIRLGDMQQALVHLEKAYEIGSALFGGEDARLIDTLNAIGVAYQHLGDLDSARPHAERHLALVSQEYGDEHLRTAESRGNLALIQIKAGDLDGARDNAQRTLSIFQAHFDEPSWRTVFAHTALGTIERKRGELDRALELHLEGARQAGVVFSAEHPLSLSAYVELAHTHLLRERFPEALASLERAEPAVDNPNTPPQQRGEARFLLAKARAGAGHRAAAVRAAAEQARSIYSEAGEQAEVDDIDAWLAARGR